MMRLQYAVLVVQLFSCEEMNDVKLFGWLDQNLRSLSIRSSLIRQLSVINSPLLSFLNI
jgi:hypothetical protein